METQQFINSLVNKFHFHKKKKNIYAKPETLKFIEKNSAIKLAQKLFCTDNTINLGKIENEMTSNQNILLTKVALTQESCIVFNASLHCKILNWICRVPIVVKSLNETAFYIIKENYNITYPQDVYEAGYIWKIARSNIIYKPNIYIILINEQYVPKEDVDIEELFLIKKITIKAKAVQTLIDRYLS